MSKSTDAAALAKIAVTPLHTVFGTTIADMGNRFETLVVLGADGEDMASFRKAHPQRFLEFGHAERNMMAAASGLAAVGMMPVVSTNSESCLRTAEQAHQSIARTRCNAKIVGNDAPPQRSGDQHGIESHKDIAAYRSVPGMTVIVPADATEMAMATKAMLEFEGPVYLRSGSDVTWQIYDESHEFKIGKGHVLRDGMTVTLVACGAAVAHCMDAAGLLDAEGISARVVNMATVSPIDDALLTLCARETGCFVTAEYHDVCGGLGSAVAESLAKTSPAPIEFLGMLDPASTSTAEQNSDTCLAISAENIAHAAKRAIERKKTT